MIIEFEIGDYSGDGHSRSDTYTYQCTQSTSYLSSENVQKAYEVGTRKLGFDLIKDCCAYHENSHLTEKNMNTLIAFGFTHVDLEEMKDYVCPEWWMEIYIFICKIGNPDIVFTEVRFQHVNIGGYGLFN